LLLRAVEASDLDLVVTIESQQPVESQRVSRGGPPAPARRFVGTLS
jgi:hypothetical protein